MENELADIKKILLVEDDAQDVELTLSALEESHLANKVAVADNPLMARLVPHPTLRATDRDQIH